MVVSGYALAFGLTLVAGGRLGDAHGRRLLMLVGLAGFVVSSAAVGLAPDERFVVIARLAQGAAAGLLTPQNSGLITELFPRPRAWTPLWLLRYDGWASPAPPDRFLAVGSSLSPDRSTAGATSSSSACRDTPATTRTRRSPTKHLDVVGAVLLGLAVLCVLLTLVESMAGPDRGCSCSSARRCSAPPFVWWGRRTVADSRAPPLDVGLLRRTPGYASGLALGTLYFTGFTGIFLVLSIFLQDAAGYSALRTGLLLSRSPSEPRSRFPSQVGPCRALAAGSPSLPLA